MSMRCDGRNGSVNAKRASSEKTACPLVGYARWQSANYASALAVTVKVVLAGMLLALPQKAPLLSA